MRFFGISQHISGMADIRGLLAAIDPAHTLDDLTLSAHHWVMGRRRDDVPLLNGGDWRTVIQERQWDRFHAEWRERLDGYDAFICFHPPVFAYLYHRFDKPIICQCSIRYEYPFHRDPGRWTEFNEYLRAGLDECRVALCANNPYDAAYAALFLGRPVPFVPSLCEYTGATWRGDRTDVLYYAAHRLADLDARRFVHKRDGLPRGHAWQDVARFTAIAHFPYTVSTMSMVEQYTMGVPLLVPTLDFAVSLYAQGARLFHENSWAATSGDAPGSVVEPAGGFPGGHDPNDYTSLESLRHWLRYADYYDESSMPGLVSFSSLEELHAIAGEAPAFFEDVHARMQASLPARRQLAVDGWRRMIEAVA